MKHYRLYLAALIAAFVIAALCGATGAKAASPVQELEADYPAALAWWGVASPPLCASVTLGVEATDPYGEGAIARATQPESAGIACRLTILEDQWATLPTCGRTDTIRHEVGHLLGYGHSSDPDNVMYPVEDLSKGACAVELRREWRREQRQAKMEIRAERRKAKARKRSASR